MDKKAAKVAAELNKLRRDRFICTLSTSDQNDVDSFFMDYFCTRRGDDDSGNYNHRPPFMNTKLK